MIAAFLDECVERLDGWPRDCFVLERARQRQRALVSEIFRDLHTQGLSARSRAQKMNRVAHLAEDRSASCARVSAARTAR
jgi:chemotaxis protein histidine kinase CheA